MYRKNMIIISIIIISILILILSSILYIKNNTDKSHIDVEIRSDTTDYRVNSNITFNTVDIPEKSNISWYIDGNLSYYGEPFLTVFNESNEYTIHVICKGDSYYGKDEMIIKVKNEDEFHQVIALERRILRPIRSFPMELQFIISEGISYPEVDININIENIIGVFTIRVIHFFSDRYPGENLYQQDYTYLSKRDFDMDFTYDTATLTPVGDYIRMQVDFELFEGALDRVEISSSVFY